MSCHDKQVILETHNRLRQMLALGQIRGQPPSLDMRELVRFFVSCFFKNKFHYIFQRVKFIRSGMKNWRLLLKGGQINVTPDMTVLEEQVIFKKEKKKKKKKKFDLFSRKIGHQSNLATRPTMKRSVII